MPNLMQASNQWATRPWDERFWTVRELDDACLTFQAQSGTKLVPYKDLLAVDVDGAVKLIGKSKNPANLTHWAFGQLAQRAQAPASYLRELPASLASECLNLGLRRRQDDEQASMLFSQNGSLTCRALLTERYSRIWNSDITKRLLVLEQMGWKVPPARPNYGLEQLIVRDARPATAEDLIHAGAHGLSVKLGDIIAPAGLYASDRDMFAFMVREDRIIDGGNGEYLRRGIMVGNSEVGAAAFWAMKFLYDSVCGNHIVWGAREVSEIRIRHIGNADIRAFGQLAVELAKYADESVGDDETRIQRAKAYVLGVDKDKVLDVVFGLHIPVLSRKRLEDAYGLAEKYSDIHGSPNTAWGLSSGLTRLSQTMPYADERLTLDRAAGKVLEIAF